MMGDMQMVGMREMGIVRSFFVIIGCMVLCRFFVILGSVLRYVRLLSCDGLLHILTCGSSCELLLPVYPEDTVRSGHNCSQLKYDLAEWIRVREI